MDTQDPDATESELPEIGEWSEKKLDVLRHYASAYTKIMAKHGDSIKAYAYIDAFAGPGDHISRQSGAVVPGSPKIALTAGSGFTHYHFIELDPQKVARIRRETEGEANVSVHEGDCHKILLEEVFPRYRWDDHRRALCLFDAYNMNPSWEIVKAAGKMRSVEIMMNFMIMDLNRNILSKDPSCMDEGRRQRMRIFWGDDSWQDDLYHEPTQTSMFEQHLEKNENELVASAYLQRLKDVADFKHTAGPFPLKNSRGSDIYYLLFASHNKVGAGIVKDIFRSMS